MTILRTVLLEEYSGELRPGATVGATQDNQSAATVINTFTEGLLATLDFPSSLEGAPDLGKNQEEARSMAFNWKNTVRIRIYNSNTLLMTQSSMFLNFYGILQDLAGELDDPAKKEQLIADLNHVSKIKKRKQMF
eukprot:gb/GEZJ01009791.1/.p1 GENE.gb/GEZJ01009791.1/~~gb/GEZJ01009791.1/.p1  ORF type:complete len:135 (-),score=13.70 gb/GEZJ01009791.1/:151-555(-)